MPVILTLICFGAVAAGFWMIDRNATLNQSLAQSESHVQELSKRLDALTIAQAQVPVAKPVSRATKKGAALRKPAVANDPRVDKLQGQLTDMAQHGSLLWQSHFSGSDNPPTLHFHLDVMTPTRIGERARADNVARN